MKTQSAKTSKRQARGRITKPDTDHQRNDRGRKVVTREEAKRLRKKGGSGHS